MVAVASREIRDGDLVFVGMRLPILAYAVARSTHAPTARGLFEVGLMRDSAASGYLGTMGDPPNVAGALWATRMSNVMALMAQGLVDRVSFITSPGNGDGSPGWRRRHRLLGGGPAAIITTLCVFRFPEGGGEAYLDSIHPGHTFEEVQKETGWAIAGARDVRVTPEPTPAELAEIRRRSA